MDTQNSGTIEQDRTLINRITYLASLTSESKAIDPMLDPLREITARWNGSQPLVDYDRNRLLALEGELKDFLITKDPLRSFSAEELEDRIHMKEAVKGSAMLNGYASAVLVSFAVAGGTYLLPIKNLTIEYRNLIAACIQMLTAQLITVWFYVSNLDNFKKEFRQAFVYISIGILPLGVLFGQIALVQMLGIGDKEPFKYAGMTYFAMLAFIIMYIGFRKYALLLSIRMRAASWAWVLSVSAAFTLLMIFIPHSSKPTSELFFDISLVAMMVGVTFAGANALLIGKIMHSVTPAYKKPLLILYIYMFAAVFGMLLATVATYLLGELRGDSLTLVILLAAVPQQLLLLYSGYLFSKYLGR